MTRVGHLTAERRQALCAATLVDHFLRQAPRAQVTRFQLRAQRPLYDTHPFTLCLARTPAGAELWTVGPEQQVTMQASLETR